MGRRSPNRLKPLARGKNVSIKGEYKMSGYKEGFVVYLNDLDMSKFRLHSQKWEVLS